MKNRVVAYLVLTLLLLEVALVFVSWLLSASMTASVHSLLSAEGIRWLCGHFVDILLSPVLIWILLFSMAWGCLLKSGLPQALRSRADYRQRLALRVTAVFFVIYFGVVLWLTVSPHAILLSATGGLWPSPFSRAFVPFLSLGIILCSVCYGTLSRAFGSLADITNSFSDGIARFAQLLVVYVFLAQLIASTHFVFYS